MSTSVAAVRAHPEKYEKDFGTVVAFLTQYINKKASTPSVKVASFTPIKATKRQKTSASCSMLLEMKTDNSSNESLFAKEKPKANKRNNPALERKENGTRQSSADTWQLGPLIGDCQPSVLRDSYIQPLTII